MVNKSSNEGRVELTIPDNKCPIEFLYTCVSEIISKCVRNYEAEEFGVKIGIHSKWIIVSIDPLIITYRNHYNRSIFIKQETINDEINLIFSGYRLEHREELKEQEELDNQLACSVPLLKLTQRLKKDDSNKGFHYSLSSYLDKSDIFKKLNAELLNNLIQLTGDTPETFLILYSLFIVIGESHSKHVKSIMNSGLLLYLENTQIDNNFIISSNKVNSSISLSIKPVSIVNVPYSEIEQEPVKVETITFNKVEEVKEVLENSKQLGKDILDIIGRDLELLLLVIGSLNRDSLGSKTLIQVFKEKSPLIYISEYNIPLRIEKFINLFLKALSYKLENIRLNDYNINLDNYFLDLEAKFIYSESYEKEFDLLLNSKLISLVSKTLHDKKDLEGLEVGVKEFLDFIESMPELYPPIINLR